MNTDEHGLTQMNNVLHQLIFYTDGVKYQPLAMQCFIRVYPCKSVAN